jgi:2-polyprenyl-3-methyl-5-hydroxy-6-metoxy-1,4-benzoquinol methylase
MSNSKVERLVVEDASYPLLQEHLNRYVFACQFVQGRRVLDIACGSGYGTDYLKRNGATVVIGVDISPEACQRAKSSYGADVVIADADRLPFRDCSFEVTVSFETIEHLSMPHDFLKQCVRLLKIGGKIIISTPNRSMSIFQDNPYHVQEYNLSLLPGGPHAFKFIQKQLFGKKISKQKDLSAIDETYQVTPIVNLKFKLVQPSFIVCTAEVSQK